MFVPTLQKAEKRADRRRDAVPPGVYPVKYAAADRSGAVDITNGVSISKNSEPLVYLGVIDTEPDTQRYWFFWDTDFIVPYHSIVQPTYLPGFDRGDKTIPFDKHGGPLGGNANPFDTSNLPAGTYDFVLVRGLTDETFQVITVPITIIDDATPLPEVPTGLSADTNTDNEVTLSWNSSVGAITYEVRFSTFNPPSSAQTLPISSGLSYTSGYLSATTYYAQVQAINAAGPSGWSAPLAFTVTASSSTDPSYRIEPWVTIPGQNQPELNMLTQGAYLTGTTTRSIPGGPYRSNMEKDRPERFEWGITTPSTPSNSKQQKMIDRWNEYIARSALRTSQLPSQGGFPSHFSDTLTDTLDMGGYIVMGTQLSWMKGSAQGYPRNKDTLIDMAKQAAGVYATYQTQGAQALHDTTVGGMLPGEWQRRLILTVYEFNAPWFSYYAGRDISLRTDAQTRNAILAVTASDLNGDTEVLAALHAVTEDGPGYGQNGDRSVIFGMAQKKLAETVHAICPDVMFDLAFANPGAEPASQTGTTLSRDFSADHWEHIFNNYIGADNLDSWGYDYYCRNIGRPYWNGTGSSNDPDNYNFDGVGSLDEGLSTMDDLCARTNRRLTFPEVGFCRAITGSGPSAEGCSDVQAAAAIKYMYGSGGVIDSRYVSWHNWFHRGPHGNKYRYDINGTDDELAYQMLRDIFPAWNSGGVPAGTFVGH